MLSDICRLAITVLPLLLLPVTNSNSIARAALNEDALKIGSIAPELDVEHWVSNGAGKFQPVTAFQPGKVYIVEFWATWCGPCIRSMPHLSQLQEKYSGKGVQIISISDEKVDVVQEFLKQNVAGTEDKTYKELTGVYCLTTDPDGSSHNSYMRASGQSGIPAAFIVGKQGHIEWIGHPAEIDGPLEKVVTDQWDRVSYTKKIEEEKKAFEEFQQVLREVSQKMQAGETKEAIALMDEAVATHKDSKLGKELSVARLELLLSTGSDRAAKALTDFAAANNEPEILTQLAEGIVQLKATGEPIDDSVLKAAEQIASEAVKAKPKDFRMLFTLARVYHQNGALDKAIATQKSAMENAGEFRERIAPFMKVLMEEKEAKK